MDDSYETVLSSLKGKNYLLIIFAHSAQSDLYQSLLFELERERKALLDRNVLVVRVLEWGENWQGNDPLGIDVAHALRHRFSAGRVQFAVLRIEADGDLRMRSSNRVSVREAVTFQRDLHSKEGEAAAATILKEGGKMVELTPEQHQAFVTAVNPVYAEARGQYSRELVALMDQYRK